ncbi:MAG: TetR/AcrR family transcriptional regulator [Prevotellaceae bacterium]|jgi:AcrR family transcriptional regulator|nr:TetR/AcrR family transcriptional regulator [Prevotellaceae bacterium]
MSEEKELKTEELILEAAEKVFINKGFAATKTTEIAKEAGVTHAMLHYYFRTKENLFNIVFQNKVQLLANSFFSVVHQDKSFTEIIGSAIEHHFDFIKENPELGLFIINEINSNEKNSKIWSDIAVPIFSNAVSSIKQMIDTEVQKGTIRPIDPVDFVQTVVSLNIFPFISKPLFKNLRHVSDKEYEKFSEQQKKENIRLVLLMLKP